MSTFPSPVANEKVPPISDSHEISAVRAVSFEELTRTFWSVSL